VAEFRARGLRARPLAAAIRHHLHWSELIGGDVVITLPAVWQRRFNASSVEVRPRMDDPVDPAILAELHARFSDFVRAYEPDGLAPDEFDTFGPSARTLRAFVGSYHELLHQVMDALVPNPDLKPAS
jgi:transaldolase